MNWDYANPFTRPAMPRPEDIDGLNHTNNAQLGEALTLATWLTASDGKLTMERRFQLIRDHDQATVLRGRWELVCIELSSGRARRMPSEFCQVYLPVMATRSVSNP